MKQGNFRLLNYIDKQIVLKEDDGTMKSVEFIIFSIVK